MKLFIFVSLLILTSCSEGVNNAELSFDEGKVTASFSKVPIQSVAALVAKKTHVVVKVYDGVDGVVNGKFDKVPLNQFLRKVFKPYNTSFVYLGEKQQNIKGVFLLNEGDASAKATVFMPSQGSGSMLSKFSQHQRSAASVSSVKSSDVADHVVKQKSYQKRRLSLYLDDLKRQVLTAKQKKEDFSGIQQKIKTLEMQVARLEHIPAKPKRPKGNRPEGLRKHSGF